MYNKKHHINRLPNLFKFIPGTLLYSKYSIGYSTKSGRLIIVIKTPSIAAPAKGPKENAESDRNLNMFLRNKNTDIFLNFPLCQCSKSLYFLKFSLRLRYSSLIISNFKYRIICSLTSSFEKYYIISICLIASVLTSFLKISFC